MYPIYRDLRQRLGTPLWHDWHGVPRYEPYRPGLQDIYAEYEALLVLQCAGCGQRFLGATCAQRVRILRTDSGDINVVPVEEPHWWGWGDAPWHPDPRGDDGGMCAGATMSAGILAVQEYWRSTDLEWQRCPAYEGPVEEAPS